jgi:hypothetical protein
MSSFPRLSFVCPIRWDELRGDERQKFCEKCGHSVTNISELSAEAREALLAAAGEKRLCVTYYRRLSGEFVTPEAPLTNGERKRVKQVGLAALSLGALALAAGCASQPVHSVANPKNESQKEAPATVTSQDETVIQLTGFVVAPAPKREPWQK